MARVLRLTVLTGPHRKQRFCFREPTDCMIGRSPECVVQLAGTERDQFISRLHCRLVLDGTSLTLQDMASTCGTYLGGAKIDSTVLPLADCDGCGACLSEAGAFDQGSLLNVGGTTLRLEIVDCPPANAGEYDTADLWKSGQTAMHNCPVRCS
jgi:pSer/pThr/pTyr-binding forkhead associated (FHA) protein